MSSPQSKDVYSKLDEGSRLNTIMAMAIGLTVNGILIDVNSFNNGSIFPQQNKKTWKPAKVLLEQEIRRRQSDFPLSTLRSSTQKMEWLVSHPVEKEDDKEFIVSKVSEFIEIYTKAKEEEEAHTRDHWKGIQPHLRLIHCITDFDEIKEAFSMSFNVMSKEELDGRNNEFLKRNDPWIMISDKWNDENFNVKSVTYPDLHEDFSVEIDIGYSSVRKMGKLTPDRAKQRYMKMKSEMMIVKNNWNASGNGDGSLDRISHQLIDANSKKNFLKGRSPAILYLWERSEKCDIIETVCQQLDPESSLDSSTGQIASLLSNRQRKKQKKKGEMEDVDRHEIMQIKMDISIKQYTLQKTEKNMEDADEKLYDVVKEMMDPENEMMPYLEKRKGFLEKRIETLEKRARELQEEISSLQEKINVSA